ncbi:MAG TPA: tRNA 5'-guanylyltransferase [Methanocorpusculum sp.]|nr:tRNA 5'-guanylyltransferase [Methanocorpusculum sp.]
MKEREIFSGVITTVPFVLRLDGRSFHRFSREGGYAKPYDTAFSRCMIKTVQALFEDSGLSPSFAYTFSDEISLYITSPIFDCRIEKLVSIAAGVASSAFTLFSGAQRPLSFDCRVVPIDKNQLVTYLACRQAEAWRNHINGYAHKLLRDMGLSTTDAQRRLNGMKSAELHELAFSLGVNLADTPTWQRRGIAMYRSIAVKDGYNPVSLEMVHVSRRVSVIDKELPLFKTPYGALWLAERLSLSPSFDE